MTVFSAKLNTLMATIEIACSAETSGLATALVSGRSRLAFAVGSGGSAVVAEFLAVCRSSLQALPTLVQTPMQFVLGSENLAHAEVWLFSARGENPDVIGALCAAVSRGATIIHVVTANDRGRLSVAASQLANASVHETKVADPNDGFLATHSLVSAISALLCAADCCSAQPLGQDLIETYVARAQIRLSQEYRRDLADCFISIRSSDVLLILADPRLAPAVSVIETSAWEAGIVPVQRTDFRNFAHGRHVWVAHRPDDTLILSLTSSETRETWSEIDKLIPSSVRRAHFDYANCGRLQSTFGILDGLLIIEALGNKRGIDPGRPGAGSFARGIYEASSLENIAVRLTPGVRHKRAAVELRDDPNQGEINLASLETALHTRFAEASFRGLVLDYDGTMVTTEDRYCPPDHKLLSELRRLLDSGLSLAIATGRGGSAGETLRTVLPSEHHGKILVGYYNGAYIRPLNIDIRRHPAPRDPGIAQALAWLKERPHLFANYAVGDSRVQLSIRISDLVNPDRFHSLFSATDFYSLLKLTRSQHSFDISVATACKTKVARVVAERSGDPSAAILCIGDSGDRFGNDHMLLGLPYGISVHEVCDRPNVCWSFFGTTVTGPQALCRILCSLRTEEPGSFRIDMGALTGGSS